MERYDPGAIEKKWQERWEKAHVFKAQDSSSRPKTYVLDMFPYPSGEGLHVGHPKGYIATDIYSRMARMKGRNVLHPMGWDAFGLPAENYALKNKIHPRVAVEKNIAHFKEQLRGIGFDYDWSREINTTDPRYYKWTQWIFLQLFKKGLAYQSNEPINWCPSCMTGLANEDLDGSNCERCGTLVEKRSLPQWVLKITAYADRMLHDLETLQWPEHIKEAQRNWIGRSEGAEIPFALTDGSTLTVFTTRPDTLFGATYMVVAPEHPLVEKYANAEVKKYVEQAKIKTEIERTTEGKEKTGVKLEGVRAINPATKEEIPIYVADYVLASYGTGAIMAVPAHDERDFAFAKKFNLPIRDVVMPLLPDPTNPHQEGKEVVFRRATINIVYDPKTDRYLTLKWKTQPWTTYVTGGVDEGEDVVESALREIAEETGYTDVKFVRALGDAQAEFYAAHKGVNRVAHNSCLLFELQSDTRSAISEKESAQHEVVWIAAKDLPTTKFQHSETELIRNQILKGPHAYTGEGILLNSGELNGLSSGEAKKKITQLVGGKLAVTYKIKDWVFSRQRYWGEPIPIVHCPKDGAVAVPEEQLPVVLPEVEHYEPSGTGESPLANIAQWVNTTCPKCGGPAKRETNTMPQWAGSSWYYLRFMDPHNTEALVGKEKERYWAPVDVYVGGDHAVRHLIYARFWHKFLYDIGVVSTIEPFARLEFLGFILAPDGKKMSKRYGNTIDPTDVVREFGADTFRLYEMFMGPFENTTPWSTTSIKGVSRFVERVWKAQSIVDKQPHQALSAIVEQTVKKVSDDIEAFKFNTAVSQLMICLNAIEREGGIGTEQWMRFLQVLNPFAPHLAHELAELAQFSSEEWEVWPHADEVALARSVVSVAVQVNGKTRAALELSPNASQEEALALARQNPAVAKWLEGKEEKKAIYVPGKIVSFVVS